MDADTSFRGEEKSSQRYFPNRDNIGKSSLTVPRQAGTMDLNITPQSTHNPNMAKNPNRSMRSDEQAAAQRVVLVPAGLSNKSPEPRVLLPSVEDLRRPMQPGTQVPGSPTGLRRRPEISTPGKSGSTPEVQSASGVQAPVRAQEHLSTTGIRPKRASDQINIAVHARNFESPPAEAPIRPGITRKPVQTTSFAIEGRSSGVQLGAHVSGTALNTANRIQHAGGQTSKNRGLHPVTEGKQIATENPTLRKIRSIDPILGSSRNKSRSAATSLRGIVSGATPGQASRSTSNPGTPRALGTVSSGGSHLPNMPRTFAPGQGERSLKPQGRSDMPQLISRGPRVDIQGPADPRVSNSTARRDPTSQPMTSIRTQSATGASGTRLPGVQTSGRPQRFGDQGLNNPIPSRPLPQRGPLQNPTNSTINRGATTTPGRTMPGTSRNQGLNSSISCKPAHSMQQRNPFTNGAPLPQRNTQLNPFPSRGSPNQMSQRPTPATSGTQRIEKHGPSLSLGLRGEINIGRSSKAADVPITRWGIHPVAFPPQRPIHQPVTPNGYHPPESQKNSMPHSIKHSGNHHGKSLHESPVHHPDHHPDLHYAESPEPSYERSDKHRDKPTEESSEERPNNDKDKPGHESPDEHLNSHPDEPHVESHEYSEEPEVKHPDEPLAEHTESQVNRAENPIHPSDAPGVKDPTDAPYNEAPHAIDSHDDHTERDTNLDRHDSDPLYPADDHKHERGHDRSPGVVIIGTPDVENPFHDTEGFETATDDHDSLDQIHDGSHNDVNDDTFNGNYVEPPDDENDRLFSTRSENEDEPFSTDHGRGEDEATGSVTSHPNPENEDHLFRDEYEGDFEPQNMVPFDIDDGHSLPSDPDDHIGDLQDGEENGWALDENHNEDTTGINEDSNSLPELHDSGDIPDQNEQPDEDPDDLFGEPDLGTHDNETQSEVGHDEELGDVEDLFHSEGGNDGYLQEENDGEVGDPDNSFEGSESGREDSNACMESDPELDYGPGNEGVGDQDLESETASGLGIDDFSAGENDLDNPDENEDENAYSDLDDRFGSDMADQDLGNDQDLDESFGNDDVEADMNDSVSENQDIDNPMEESGNEQHQLSDVDEGIGSDMGDNELQSDPEVGGPLAGDDFGDDMGDDGLEPEDGFDDPIADTEDGAQDAVDEYDEPSADDAFEGGIEGDAYEVETANDYDDSGTGDYDGGQVEDYGDYQADNGYDAVDTSYDGGGYTDGGGGATYDDSYDARYE